jgi:hypothetical protein
MQDGGRQEVSVTRIFKAHPLRLLSLLVLAHEFDKELSWCM